MQFWKWWNANGKAEFMVEKGLNHGNDTPAGSGSEGTGVGDQASAIDAAPEPERPAGEIFGNEPIPEASR